MSGLLTCQSTSDRPSSTNMVIHRGATEFVRASCFKLVSATNVDTNVDIANDVEKAIRGKARSLPPCQATSDLQLWVLLEAGHGVCIDCESPPSDPLSGFALISLLSPDGTEIAAAEWQYRGGGTMTDLVEHFSSAIVNLARDTPRRR